MRLFAILALSCLMSACATHSDPESAELAACSDRNIVRDTAPERARLKDDERSWALANSIDSVRREYSNPAEISQAFEAGCVVGKRA